MVRLPCLLLIVLMYSLLFPLVAAGGTGGKLLVVGGDHDNSPYEVLENGIPTGFNIELIRAVASTMGMDVNFRLTPWNQARHALERGDINVLAGMYYSEERSKKFDFSVFHTLVTPGLFVQHGSPLRKIGDLSGKNIVVQQGDVIHDMLQQNHINANIIAVQSPLEALRTLAAGQCDCVLTPSKLQSDYLVSKYGLKSITSHTCDLPQLKYCFAVRKGNQELLYKLDEGLNILKANGTYQIIYNKWFGIYEQQDFWLSMRYFVLALAVVGLLLLVTFFWSWSLRRQVHKRTAELLVNEQELRKAHTELEQRVSERTAELGALNRELLSEILERKQVEEGLRSTNQRLDVLADMASQLLMSDSPQKTILSLCRKVMDLLNCDIFFNYLIDTDTNRLRLNAYSGISEADVDKMEWLDLGVGLCGKAALDGARLVVCNLQNSDDPYAALVKPFGVRAYACHPLIFHGRVMGTLSFCSRKKEQFSEEDLSLMKVVADHVAIAIERKRAGEQLNQRREQLEELNRTLDQRVREMVVQNRQKDLMLIRQNRQAAMGEMLDHIAHQWKQPLNSIYLIVQEMGEACAHNELTTETITEAIAKIMAISEHMSQTVNVFRDFYKPEKEKKVFNIKESIASALAFITPSLRVHSISVELAVDPTLFVYGYSREYAQVLLNILSNARDVFVSRNSIQPHLVIQARRENELVVVTITDNAGGVASEIVEKIFDLYFTTNAENGGTGIGLYMSKNIIEKNMGGSLTVENDEYGATFRIEVNIS